MSSITVQADGAEERFALEAAVVTIGRGLEADIRIKDIKASRRHCQVVKTPEGFKLVDLGSGNGTFVNGIQVKEQPLKTGDQIQVGQTVIVFDAGAQEEPKKTATAALPKVGPARRAETARMQALQTKRAEPKPAAPGRPAPAKAAVAAKPLKKGSTSRIEKAKSETGPMEKKTGRAMARAPRETKKTNPLIIVGVVAAVLLVVGGLWLAMRGEEKPKEKPATSAPK